MALRPARSAHGLPMLGRCRLDRYDGAVHQGLEAAHVCIDWVDCPSWRASKRAVAGAQVLVSELWAVARDQGGTDALDGDDLDYAGVSGHHARVPVLDHAQRVAHGDVVPRSVRADDRCFDHRCFKEITPVGPLRCRPEDELEKQDTKRSISTLHPFRGAMQAFFILGGLHRAG
jgi:hypothetical protein